MNIIITENYDAMSKKAAEIMIDIVKNNPNAVLGLATGSSPIGMYQYMAKDCKENGTSYKNVSTVNLDEYVGLTADHNQSYAYFMRDNLSIISISISTIPTFLAVRLPIFKKNAIDTTLF